MFILTGHFIGVVAGFHCIPFLQKHTCSFTQVCKWAKYNVISHIYNISIAWLRRMDLTTGQTDPEGRRATQ